MSNNSLYNKFTLKSTGSTPYKSTSTSNSIFSESNSLVSKVAFLLLVIFGFIIALRLGIMLLSVLFNRGQNPHLINGMVDATQSLVITQNPATKGSKTISRSINQSGGIEFTWSVWIYVNGIDGSGNRFNSTNAGVYRHIFSKGTDSFLPNGLNFPNNAPGLYLTPYKNELLVIMNTNDVINEEIRIPDIPLNKWVNVIMRCVNTTLDVYINGIITKSTNLSGVPKQNYGNVYVAMNGGFSGYISNLWYYSKALNSAEIQRISVRGPTTKINTSNSMLSGLNLRYPNYLSLQWYFSDSNNR
uniref:LamG-like jellyroll fold domain-containing protein n=1 Tax=viral metagenome TaxID=1070528 RepID=A0A6C0E337_9ZZZZ